MMIHSPADETVRANDPQARRRARVMLALFAILLIGGSVGAYWGWQRYEANREATLIGELEASGYGGVGARRGRIGPRTTQRFDAEMQRRGEQSRQAIFDRTLAAFVDAKDAAGRVAVVDRSVRDNRGRWLQVLATPPAADSPEKAALLQAVRDRMQRGGRSTTTRPATTRPADASRRPGTMPTA